MTPVECTIVRYLTPESFCPRVKIFPTFGDLNTTFMDFSLDTLRDLWAINNRILSGTALTPTRIVRDSEIESMLRQSYPDLSDAEFQGCIDALECIHRDSFDQHI